MERVRGRTGMPGRDMSGSPSVGSPGGCREGPGIDIAGRAAGDRRWRGEISQF